MKESQKDQIELKLVCDTREQLVKQGYEYKKIYDHDTDAALKSFLSNYDKEKYKIEYLGGVQNLIDLLKSDDKYLYGSKVINLSAGLVESSRRQQVPVILELLGVKFSGSPITAIALAENKYFTSLAVSNIGFNTPDNFFLNTLYTKKYPSYIDETLKKIERKNRFPYIVKGNREDSSVGLNQSNICSTISDIKKTICIMQKEFEIDEFLIEEYISGYEVSHYIIGNINNIKVSEIFSIGYNGVYCFQHPFIFGNEEKKGKNRTRILIEEISDLANLADNIEKTSLKIMENICVYDFLRIDYRVNDGKLYFIELNVAPAISESNEIGFIARFEVKSTHTTLIISLNHF